MIRNTVGGETVLLVAARALILYTLVVVVMRVMGKRQVGEMQPYELVIAIMIAELAAVPMGDNGIPITNGIVAILMLLVAEVMLSVVSLHSEKAREIICGKPTILINDGRLVPEAMRESRVNLNDLMEQLRTKNYPDISDVAYAILETTGHISVIPKPQSAPPTAKDLGVAVPEFSLPITLVMDGELQLGDLKRTGITVDQLVEKAKAQGIHDLRNVFFAQLSSHGEIEFQDRSESGGGVR